MRRRVIPVLLAFGLLTVVAVAALPAMWSVRTASAAQAVQCAAAINGVPVEQYGTYGRALELRPDDVVRVDFATNAAVPVSGTVSAELGPVTIPLESFQTAGGVWQSDVSAVSEQTRGTGLYRVVFDAAGCGPISGWVKISGRNPLTTPIGGSAAATVGAGAIAVVGAAIRGVRSRKGLTLAVVGGALGGLGACVLNQQFGNAPVTWSSWATWTVPFTGFGVVLNVGASTLGRRGEEEGAPEGEGAAPDSAGPGPRGSTPFPWPRPPFSRRNGAGAGRPEPSSAPPAAPPSQPTPAAPPVPRAEEETASPVAEAGTVAANGGVAQPETREGQAGPDTYTAHGLLDCPPVVVAAREFTLEVGVAPEAATGVAGEAFELPSPGTGRSYELVVDLDIQGFTLRAGESMRQSLVISDADRYPTTVVHLLAASPQGADPDIRSVRALYVVGGAVLGYARRHIAVVATEASLDGTAEPPEDEVGTVAIPSQGPVADLTVVIEEDEQARGRLRWTLTSPHASGGPTAPMVTDIGADPQQFARQLVDGVGAREGKTGLAAFLSGVGNTIAEELPSGFWPALQSAAEAARAQDRPPTVFILSEEPYVPWELATVEPRLDQAAPPFLGAQARVGRWVLGTRRPKLPPPTEVAVASMAVVSGEYALPGWSRLAEAEAEAAALQSLYGAVPVNALTADVLQCLRGTPPAELLHFAMHGIYDPNSTLNGLVLADGQTVDPLQVRGLAFTNPPFVFLNACQVGSSQRLLGDYAGLAEAFLFSGAAGVVAPLWSIKDVTAREIALRFYEQTFQGVPPAEILRRERGAFEGGPEDISATSLAYLFYGHPSLLLRRTTGVLDA
ncbi:MAG: CHAT domain-containing protein [Dehalococcoidia bacterium]|nr:CHAT domain-containing protein [Dehalococcoidia bacterium]